MMIDSSILGLCMNRTKRLVFQFIETWEKRCYGNGIPDEADFNLERLNKVPSYRSICRALLKNDVALKALGFSRPKSRTYNILKGIEIASRENRKPMGELF